MKLDGDRIIGIVLIAIPFVVITIYLINMTGLISTLEYYSAVIIASGILYGGAYLLTTKK